MKYKKISVTQKSIQPIFDPEDNSETAVCPFCEQVNKAYYQKTQDGYEWLENDFVNYCNHFMGFYSGGNCSVIGIFQGIAE